jgi:signal recognition particle receptor subunit beta
MVQINFAQKTVNVKIVYYGPGMSGKTTNLEVIHQRAPESNRGDLTSISTDGDRTLFFDYMPLDLGTVAGMRTAFQLYTVPGQVYYNSTRKLVLQGVDGIIFVADSSASMVNQNLESLRNLEENLNEYGKSLATLPHVIQLNKRDLPDALTVEELSRMMNAHNAPLFEAVANTGQGVFPTLKSLAANVLRTIISESGPKSTPLPPAPSSPGAGQPRPGAPARQQAPQARPPAQFPQPQPAMPAHAAQPAYPTPTYPPVGAPVGAQSLGTSGFFNAAAAGTAPHAGRGQPPASHAPQHPGGLQLAQPSMGGQPGHLSQTRSQPRPALNVAGSQQHRPAPAPAPRPQQQQRAAPAPSARPRTAPKVQSQPQKSSKGKLAPIIIAAGAGVGAVVAWVLMNVL